MGVLGDDYQLEVLRAGTTPLAQVHHDGETYVVAAPGAAYKLRLKGSFQGPVVVKAFIDGKSTCGGFITRGGRSELLYPGWLASNTTTSSVYRDFLFAGAQQEVAGNGSHAPQSLEFQEGKIEIKFYGVRDTGVPIAPPIIQRTVATAAVVPKLGEGKKFFLAPSLTTGAGAKSEHAVCQHATQLVTDAVPTKTLTLRYETAGTLLLRGILRRDVAAHAAILDACPETCRAADEEEEEEDESRAGPSTTVGRDSRTGLGVKRERSAAVEVDLTCAPLNQRDEVAAAARAGKTLTCDLTDDAEPQWVAVKKIR